MTDNPRRLGATLVTIACLMAARPTRGDERLLDDLSAMRANRLSGLRNVSVTEQVNGGVPSAGRTQNVLTVTVLWPVRLVRRGSFITYSVGEIGAQPGLDAGDGRVVGLGDTVVNSALDPQADLRALLGGRAGVAAADRHQRRSR